MNRSASARRKDLPPGAGPLTRLHAQVGDALIWLANLGRPPLTIGVRLVALDAGGRVFLVRHSYRPGWHLPGGGVEADETVREAVRREATEEGALSLPSAPELFHLYHFRTAGRRDHIALFVARDVSEAENTSVRSLEIRERGFFPPDALPASTTRATRARIAEVLAGAIPPDRW